MKTCHRPMAPSVDVPCARLRQSPAYEYLRLKRTERNEEEHQSEHGGKDLQQPPACDIHEDLLTSRRDRADRTTPGSDMHRHKTNTPSLPSLCRGGGGGGHSTDINHVVLSHSTLSSNGATATIPFSGLTERKPLSYLPSQTGCKDGRIPAGTWIRPHLFSERSLHHLRALKSRQRRDGREIRSYLFGFLPSTRQSILSPVRRSSTSSKPASARPSFTSSKV